MLLTVTYTLLLHLVHFTGNCTTNSYTVHKTRLLSSWWLLENGKAVMGFRCKEATVAKFEHVKSDLN